MVQKDEVHVFEGMQQDKGMIYQESKYLRNALNIRLTPRKNLIARQDHSGMIITNERGPKFETQLFGAYMGHAVLNNYVVLFTSDNSLEEQVDRIYRIEYSSETKLFKDAVILYEGFLNFNIEHPLQTLADFETDYILKVYWTDGLNQPRVINIMSDRISKDNTQFDFVRELLFNEVINVERLFGTTGEFDPGVILYAFTYYNEFLLETNIFYTTPLYYTSHPDRGGKPTEKVANSFKITIKNPDIRFDYLRIYSILRTSFNDTPYVKRVQDISLKDIMPVIDGSKMIDSTSQELRGYITGLRGNGFNQCSLRGIYSIRANFNDPSTFIEPTSDLFQLIRISLYYSNINNTLYYWDALLIDCADWINQGATDIQITINKNGVYENYYMCLSSYKNILFIPNTSNVYNNSTAEQTCAIPDNIVEANDHYIFAGNVQTIVVRGRIFEHIDPYIVYNLNRKLLTLYSEKTSGIYRVSFIDTGLIGETVDPKQLLFVGGNSITAETLCQKDGTLFLGNIKTLTLNIVDLSGDVIIGSRQNNIFYNPQNLTCTSKTVNLGLPVQQNPYYYYSSLSLYTGGFKRYEWYRCGIQLLHKTGKWSAPIWVGDVQQTISPSFDSSIGDLSIPSFTYTLSADCIQLLKQYNSDFIKIRPVVVFPSAADRNVVLQGIACPTLYTTEHRSFSKDLYSQSSWFLRSFTLTQGSSLAYDTNNGWEELNNVYQYTAKAAINNTVPIRNVEIQGVFKNSDKFRIDKDFITLHSPELIFDEDIWYTDYRSLKLLTCGLVYYNRVLRDIDIICKSAPIDTKGLGVVHKSFIVSSNNNIIFPSNSDTDLQYAGLYYDDFIVWDDKNNSPDKQLAYFPWSYNINEKAAYAMASPVKWLVYPWHRNGSLNNDSERLGKDAGARSSELETKRMSNLFYGDTSYSGTLSLDLIDAQVFSSDLMELIKVDSKVYYGNVDTLLASDDFSGFYFAFDGGNAPSGDLDEIISGYIGNLKTAVLEDNSRIYNILDCLERTYSSDPFFSSVSISAYLYKYFILQILAYSEYTSFTTEDIGTIHQYCELARKYWEVSITTTYITSTLDSWVANLYDDQVNPPVRYTIDDAQALRETYTIITSLYVNGNSGTPDEKSAELLFTKEEKPTEFNSVVNGHLFYNKAEKDATKTRVFYRGYSKEGSGFTCIGRTDSQLSIIRPNIRMKYRSTPHVVLYTQNSNISDAYPLMELYRYPQPDPQDPTVDQNRLDTMFGGTTEDAVKQCVWIPAGPAKKIKDMYAGHNNSIEYVWGDTWYLRFDCLKTYAFTPLDINLIVEIASFMVESKINLDGRYDRNRGLINNTLVNPTNFNLLNTVYSQHDNFFNYQLLDDNYYQYLEFNNQITWSTEKTPGMQTDPWTKVTLAAVYNLDGDKGDVTKLISNTNTLYCFLTKGISQLLFNARVLVEASDGVPIEISNNYKMEGKVYISENMGADSKVTVKSTPSGIYFIDCVSKELYRLGDKGNIEGISAPLGLSRWFSRQNSELWYPGLSKSLRLMYDSYNSDLYIGGSTIQEMIPHIYDENDEETYPITLCMSEKLGLFTSFMDYGDLDDMFNIQTACYGINYSRTYDGIPYTNIYEMFAGLYNNFFGQYKPFYIEFICNESPITLKFFTTIDMKGLLWKNQNPNDDMITKISTTNLFDHVRVWHEYLDSGSVALNKNTALPSIVKNKQGMWRIDVPRDLKNDQGNTYGLNRISNLWANIRLSMEDLANLQNNSKIELYTVGVSYNADVGTQTLLSTNK